jgi:hypothetical protein
MRWFLLIFFSIIVLPAFTTKAQFSFELSIETAIRVGNTDQFSVNGTLLSGRIEKSKVYFLEDGTKLTIQNIISSKSATSVPVASAGEHVSLAFSCADFMPGHGDVLRGITTRPAYGSVSGRGYAKPLAEGVLSCRINGKLYRAVTVTKPVFIRASNVLDLFFKAADESVIWLQLNGFSEITEMPHKTSSDTSVHDMQWVCKIAYMPEGYRPTDMPTFYKGYEDFKGNSGIIVTAINRYAKTITLEFSGILAPNKRMVDENGASGLFYITEGRIDQIGWDEF